MATALLANGKGIIKETRGRQGEYTSLGGILEIRGQVDIRGLSRMVDKSFISSAKLLDRFNAG